jgi:hypothetical protein
MCKNLFRYIVYLDIDHYNSPHFNGGTELGVWSLEGGSQW